jgi:hypothetical protein
MDDKQPDPPAGTGEEADHTTDPRGTEVSDQKPEEAPAGTTPGDADGGDD